MMNAATKMRPPMPRTLTRRRAIASEIKRGVRKYADLTHLADDSPEFAARAQHARVTALLWIMARAERALWLESGGVLGDEVSTPRRIVSRVVVREGQ